LETLLQLKWQILWILCNYVAFNTSTMMGHIFQFWLTDLFLWLFLPQCLAYKTTQNIQWAYWGLLFQQLWQACQ
jgi:hypothetical protein